MPAWWDPFCGQVKKDLPNSSLFRRESSTTKKFSFFADFYQKVLKCYEVAVENAIRFGELNVNDQTNTENMPLKLVLLEKEQEAKFVEALKNLKKAGNGPSRRPAQGTKI